MIVIPETAFKMGTSLEQVEELLRTEDWATEWYEEGMFQIEQPQHVLIIPTFQIALKPVSNLEFYLYICKTGYQTPKYWNGFQYPIDKANHPVVGVSYQDAVAYCSWLGEQANEDYRLPTEAEWELAARGKDGRMYPWGNEFDPWRCNTKESGKGDTTPVGNYSPGGDSVWGLTDMTGNVYEWTNTLFKGYPYDPHDSRENISANATIVIRGGAWYYSRKLARCASREHVQPDYTSPAVGFRIAKTVK